MIIQHLISAQDAYVDEGDKKILVGDDTINNSSRGSISSTNRITHLAGLPETGFNYVNSIIGSGVIGIPYALNRSGFGLGLFLLFSIAVLTDYSLCILVKAGNMAGVSTYQDVVEAAFGRPGFYLLTLIQFIYPFIAMISYNVIIGDTATKVLYRLFNLTHGSFFINRNTVVLLATLTVTLPLSLQRNIAKLNRISLLSLLLVMFIMMFIMWRLIFPFSPYIPRSQDAYSLVGPSITEAIGIISFAYMCHHSSFLVYSSMENPSQSKWNQITHISLGASFIIVLIFGVTGYASFTGYSQGDLLENYCMDDNWAQIARIMFAITILLTYPIECFVVREVIQNSHDKLNILSEKAHIILTVCIVVVCYLLSMLTDCLGIVLQLNGVLAAVPLAYVLPAATFLKLHPGRLMTWEKAPAVALALTGIAAAICGTFLSMMDVLNGYSCSHGVEMPYCSQNFVPQSSNFNGTVSTFHPSAVASLRNVTDVL